MEIINAKDTRTDTKKTDTKKVQKKSAFRKGAEKPRYAFGKTDRAPYHDPYDNHVHIWTHGTLANGPQNPKSRYCSGKSEPFTGRYCKVCHEVRYPFYQTSDTSNMKGDPYYVRNLREAMRAIKERPMRNWEVILRKLDIQCVSNNVLDFNSASKMDELLTLEGAYCKVYKQEGVHRILKVTEGVVEVQDSDGDVQGIQETLVIPVYDIPKYAPISEPPRIVPKGTSKAWKQRWETYKRWKVLQEELKIFLPEIKMGIVPLMRENEDIPRIPSSNCVCKIASPNCGCWRLSVDLGDCKFLIKSGDRVTRNYVTVAGN